MEDFAVSRRSSHHGRWSSLVIYENPARVLRFEDVDRFKKNVFILSKIFQKQFLKIIAHLYIFSWKVAYNVQLQFRSIANLRKDFLDVCACIFTDLRRQNVVATVLSCRRHQT